jgi:hypothetical protein
MSDAEVLNRLQEVEAGLKLNYSAFSEQYYELRRQVRLFRTACHNAKAIVHELWQLGKNRGTVRIFFIYLFLFLF